jgi:hypothetical protein
MAAPVTGPIWLTAAPGSLTDSEIAQGIDSPRTSELRLAELLTEAGSRRKFRESVPDPSALDDDVLAQEALWLWHPDPSQRGERYAECLRVAEQRRQERIAAMLARTRQGAA